MATFPDDGIPVLTEIVDAALLPDPESDPAPAPDEPEGPPSLSMFPELDTPATSSDAHPPADAGAPAWSVEPAHFESAPAHDAPLETSPVEAASFEPAHLEPALDDPVAEPAPLDAHPAGIPLDESAAPLPAFATGVAYESAFDASHAPVATPTVHGATQPDPATPAESRSELETRIFESLAARMERLVDERIEAVLPGVVDAAFSGIKAGLAATLRAGVREAVERAVRDEFERRQDPD